MRRPPELPSDSPTISAASERFEAGIVKWFLAAVLNLAGLKLLSSGGPRCVPRGGPPLVRYRVGG